MKSIILKLIQLVTLLLIFLCCYSKPLIIYGFIKLIFSILFIFFSLLWSHCITNCKRVVYHGDTVVLLFFFVKLFSCCFSEWNTVLAKVKTTEFLRDPRGTTRRIKYVLSLFSIKLFAVDLNLIVDFFNDLLIRRLIELTQMALFFKLWELRGLDCKRFGENAFKL